MSKQTASRNAQHTRVLIYTKDFHNASVLRSMLEAEIYEVRTAFLAEEVDSAVESFQPSVIMASYDLFPLTEKLAGVKAIALAPMGRFREVGDVMARYSIPCLTYPFDRQEVKARLETFENVSSFVTPAADPIPELVGASPLMKRFKESLLQAATTSATVLIIGETGTGKELAAQALHRLGKRARGPFVPLNCAALAEGLLETELFGHERGAFTGAVKKHEGKLSAADSGTLFLDELGDMPPALQVKFLRVLESGSFHPVGSERERTVNIRYICATNRDLFKMVEEGTFRRDLLYRVNVVLLHLPPLRDRGDDLKLLAEIYLKRFAQKYERPITGFSRRALKKLASHQWPGNVRELMNTIERAVLSTRGSTIEEIKNLGDDLARSITPAPSLEELGELTYEQMKETVLAHYEKRYFETLLSLESGRVQRVAERCGLDRKTLYRKMKQFGIDKKDYR